MEENQSRLIDVIDDMCQAKNALFHMVRNARDIMSCNVKTLTLDDTIQTSLEIMTENNIRHIPILDIATEKNNNQYFVGIVSQRDVFRQISPYLEKTGGVESDRIALQQLLVQIVTRQPKSASPETPIQDIAKMMVENRIDSIPVLYENELVGIVTATDILKLFVRLHEIGELNKDQPKTEPKRRFVDLLSSNSDRAAWALSSVLGTVKDIMTEQVVSLQEQDNLNTVMNTMQNGKFRHVPIVDEQNKLIGIISDRDVLRFLPFRKSQRKPQSEIFRSELFDVEPNEPTIYQQVYRVMNRDVVQVQQNHSFYDVVKILHDKRISSVPVTDKNNKLVGIATVTDVMRGLLAAHALFEKTKTEVYK